MGAEEKISITLSEELSESVRKAVESGPFGSPEAVVAAALQYWQSQRERDLAKLRGRQPSKKSAAVQQAILERIQRRLDRLPVLDPRSFDDLIGYDEAGLPG